MDLFEEEKEKKIGMLSFCVQSQREKERKVYEYVMRQGKGVGL